jgi:hypothetical protein
MRIAGVLLVCSYLIVPALAGWHSGQPRTPTHGGLDGRYGRERGRRDGFGDTLVRAFGVAFIAIWLLCARKRRISTTL